MAMLDAILLPAQSPATTIQNLGSGVSTIEQALGANTLFSINADQDITIRFGVPGFSAAASATDFRIPANSTFTYDVGRNYTSFKCFNLAATPVNIYIMFMSKF